MNAKEIKNKTAIPDGLGDCRFLFLDTKELVNRIDNLDTYPTNRSNFKVNYLCDAINKQGILSPIIVHILNKNSYELIDGLKRIFCAIENNISPIPVLACGKISELGLASTFAINNIHFRPCGFELLNGIYMLVNERGIDISDIAKSLMKKVKTIKNWLATMNKFYSDIYPQFNNTDYAKFIEFVEKECFSASKVMYCVNKANSPEQLTECLTGRLSLTSPTEIKTVKEVQNEIRKTGAKAEDIKNALSIYSALNKHADKMPKECIEFLNKILGDYDGKNE
jgi:predicted transcriptional regulator